MAKPRKMTDEDVVAAIDSELDFARAQRDGTLGTERKLAYDYYFGKEFGNEVPGQSRVVSQLVMEVVDSLMPDMMRIFCGGDKVVEFVARRPEHVELAEQATETCNHVIFSDNNGFTLIHDWIKDGLLQKTGVVKYWWEESVDVEEKSYEALTVDQVQMLIADGYEVVAATPRPDVVLSTTAPPVVQGQPSDSSAGGMAQAGGMPATPPPEVPVDITVRKKVTAGHVCIESVPPDEFLVSVKARGPDVQALPMCAHEVKKTLSDLVDMGLCSVAEALDLPSGEAHGPVDNDVAQARADRVDSELNNNDSEGNDPMLREVVLAEVYTRLDIDGDGIAELVKVFKVGDVVLGGIEKTDRIPFAVLTPKLMPHEFYGVSVADDVMDLQLLKSALWRLQMDSLYAALYPRQQVIEGLVTKTTYADLLEPGPGRPVRVKGQNAVTPMVTPYVGDAALPMLEFIEQELEGRSPVNRQYQGLPDNAINKTATSATIVANRSQARTELIARVFAETGFRELFRGILWLLGKYQTQPKIVRLSGSYTAIHPEAWKNEYDMSINVGLGLGNKAEQLMLLNNMAQAQAMAAQNGGMGVLVTPKNIYNLQAKIASLSGFKDPDQFWSRPPDNWQPPQPPPDPAVQVAQIKAQTDQAKQQAEQQADVQKFAATQQLEAQRLAAETAAKERQAEREAALKREEMQMTLQVQAANDARQAELDKQKAALDMLKLETEYAFKRWETEFNAQTQVHVEGMRTQPVADTANETKSMAALVKELHEMSNAPREVVRGPDGRVAGVKIGNKVRQVRRDDQGKINGVH